MPGFISLEAFAVGAKKHTLNGENVKKMHQNGITVLKLSFEEVNRLFYARKLPGCVAQTVARLTQEPEARVQYPVRPHTFVLLPLIQEGQLSVTGESMSTKYWLTA